MCLRRRVYRTEKGYLGLGPHSLKCRDQIWFINGVKVLFVMRKTPELDALRLVGETYLHKFMHGEIFQTAPGLRIGRISVI
jgi:hypothetical protein